MSTIFEIDYLDKISQVDIATINYRYLMEQKMMEAIYLGNYELLTTNDDTNAPENFDPKVKRFTNDMLRDRKNGLTIRRTLMRVAAMRAGVPPVMLHILTEHYAFIIERATSARYLDEVVADQMAYAFCEVVSNFSTINHSEVIKETLIYIDANISNEISLNSIADAIHVHPVHLSRKFKQEKQIALTEYINQQRINLAKIFFQAAYISISDVGSKCGFNSVSYFSKVFKKMEGVSPKEYIEAYKAKEEAH